MSSQVLQCPLCSQPFQVLAEQSGQAVKCPSCNGAVMVPPDLSSASAPTPPPTSTQKDQLVFGCPLCQGQFAITAEMYGQQVGCPHCQSPVMIQAPASPNASPSMPKSQVDDDDLRESDLLPPKKSLPSSDKLVDKPPIVTSVRQTDVRTEQSADERNQKAALSGLSQIVVDSAEIQPAKTGDEPDDTDKKPAEDSESTEFVPQSIDHLLPPRFDVIDPERLALRGRRTDDHEVILPDGKGGLKKVDDRIVRIKHGAKEIDLVSLSSEELRRRRQIQNAIFMIGGAVVLAIVFALLRKSV